MSRPVETLSDSFDMKAAGRLVRRHIHVILGCAAIGLAAGYGYDRAQTPLYTATTRIDAVPAAARVLSSIKLEEGGAGTLRVTSTTRERLRSRRLAEQVVEDLALDAKPRFLKPNVAAASNDGTIDTLLAEVDERATRRATELVRRGLDVQFVRNTGLLKVNFTHPDSEMAALVANGVARSYIGMEQRRLERAAEQTREVISRQLAQAETQLKASEERLADFAADTELAVTAEGAPVQSEELAALRRALVQATSERVAAERRLHQLERDGVETLPAAFANGTLQNARNMISRLRAEYRMKSARMKPQFPAMLSLADRIRDFEDELRAELAVVAEVTRAEARQARDGEAILRDEIAAAQVRMGAAQQASVGYSALKRQADAERKRYASLASKLADINISAGLIVPTVAVAELATVPSAPSNGSLLVHLLLGLGLFGALGAAFATYREATRDLFDMPADVTAATGVPVLGTVPKVAFGRAARQEANQASALREAYRYLRAKLRTNALSGEGRTLLVTGLGHRAGASLTARRIALDLAALNKQVLLIDADMKRGAQHKALGISNTRGLGDLLLWEAGAGIASCFSKVDGTSLTVLTTGSSGADIGDLLASERMARALVLLRQRFDAIVIDAAPVLSRADAAALSTYADATLLVMRSDRTTRSETDAALLHLQEAGATIAGALFTRYERRAFQRAAAPDLRDRFETLRDLVPVRGRADAGSNPVHDMLATADAAMRKRAAA